MTRHCTYCGRRVATLVYAVYKGCTLNHAFPCRNSKVPLSSRACCALFMAGDWVIRRRIE